MLYIEIYRCTAPRHTAKWQETENVLAGQNKLENPSFLPCAFPAKQQKFWHARKSENVQKAALCIEIGRRVDAEPCSKVPGHSKCPSMLDNLRKSMVYIENYSKTALSHAAKQQKQQICQKFIYCKTAPSHAAKCQETTNFLACQKMSEHQWFTLKSTANQRPAMQRSCRRQQNLQRTRKCSEIIVLA